MKFSAIQVESAASAHLHRSTVASPIDSCPYVALACQLDSGHAAVTTAIKKFGPSLDAMSTVSRDLLAQVGQQLWSGTLLAHRQRRELSDWICRHPLDWLNGVDTLVDLGAGDGRVAHHLLSALRFGASFQRVFLVDRNSQSLESATRLFEIDNLFGTQIIPRRSDIRNKSIWCDIDPTRTVVLANSSLHEVNRSEKIAIINSASKNARSFILTELASDHDSCRNVTLDFQTNVLRFYDSLIADALASLPSSQQFPVAGAFLLGELYALLTQPYENRRNYHQSPDQWRMLFQAHGFDVSCETLISLVQPGPPTYFLLAHSKALRQC